MVVYSRTCIESKPKPTKRCSKRAQHRATALQRYSATAVAVAAPDPSARLGADRSPAPFSEQCGRRRKCGARLQQCTEPRSRYPHFTGCLLMLRLGCSSSSIRACTNFENHFHCGCAVGPRAAASNHAAIVGTIYSSYYMSSYIQVQGG